MVWMTRGEERTRRDILVLGMECPVVDGVQSLSSLVKTVRGSSLMGGVVSGCNYKCEMQAFK